MKNLSKNTSYMIIRRCKSCNSVIAEDSKVDYCHNPKCKVGLKWVYGTRTNEWYLVDNTDRDYNTAISQDEMKRIGFEEAKVKYLSPSQIG